MGNASPMDMLRELEARYRRYLMTTFSFRDPQLRASFAEALERAGALSRGPFIEGRPSFRRTVSVRELCSALLGRAPDSAFLHALDGEGGERRLFSHQEVAIRKALKGDNVLVATGTGSGKTEAFLYPILLSLYKEFLEGRRPGTDPGVRAIILYPMNALANDQMERLRTIATRLKEGGSSFSFTFGEYVGATPEDPGDVRRRATAIPEGARDRGELVFRRDMRKTPPDILLTNYSMLEYLLIRPHDSELFDNGAARHWRFIVMDEAHQYTGIRGTEMGMLMRRLKQRLREGGREGDFTCVATSATIVGEDKNLKAVASFASILFGESFSESAVVLGEPVPVGGNPTLQLAPDDYRYLCGVGKAELLRFAGEKGIAVDAAQEPEALLGAILLADASTLKLIDALTEPKLAMEVAESVFPELADGAAVRALEDHAALLSRARHQGGEPLITLRYHHFLRALEGAYVSFHPEVSVSLERGSRDDTAKFELAICQDCGQEYVVGRVHDGRLEEAVRDPSSTEFGVSYFVPLGRLTSQQALCEESSVSDCPQRSAERRGADETELSVLHPSHVLCGVCARIVKVGAPLDCGHDHPIGLSLQDSDPDSPDELRRCATCGRKGRDPAKEVIHGADGPHSVIATALHAMLEPERRKVLAFADGRQDAAFFAWYAGRSYETLRNRAYLLAVIRRKGPGQTGLSISDLSCSLRHEYVRRGVFGPAASPAETTRRAAAAVLSEVLSTRSRISLEGVGLVRWQIKRPPWIEPPAVFAEAPWSLPREDAWRLASLLFDAARLDGAVSWPQDPNAPVAWDDLDTDVRAHSYTSGSPGSRTFQRAWAGKATRRVRLLARVLERLHGMAPEAAEVQAEAALTRLWSEAVEADSGAMSDRFFVAGLEGRQLNLAWWRFYPVDDSDTVYVCDTCAQVSAVETFGVCTRPRCMGTMRAVRLRDLPEDHYRALYAEEFPGEFRAEEHTAQLAAEKAREYQEDFRDGRIHLLSSSTTFELGVDLGNLDTVFLRNVPPQPFNYVQRVGRAGRRPGRPGMAITYCRRGPHDLYHFSHPERMLSGRLDRPPVTALSNARVILRHMAAYCLHVFFEENKARFETVKALVGDFRRPTLVRDVRSLIRARRGAIEAALKGIVPGQAWSAVGLAGGNADWVDLVCGPESTLRRAERVACADWEHLVAFIKRSSDAERFEDAQWAADRRSALERDEVLSFLSRSCVIPKYGFPVDVVPLEMPGSVDREQGRASARRDRPRADLSQGYGVELNRGLSVAISEYAPGSKVIANKREWTSCGIKAVAGLTWPARSYRCSEPHGLLQVWDKAEPEPEPPDACRGIAPRTYVVPVFGFVTERKAPQAPRRRVARQYTTRPYFANALSADTSTVTMPTPGEPLLALTKAFPGRMVELCEGRGKAGFWVCSSCGRAMSGALTYPGHHEDPYGQDCRGTPERVSLGHEFETDIVEVRFLLPWMTAVGIRAPGDAPAGLTGVSGAPGAGEPQAKHEQARAHALADTRPALWFSYSLAYALLSGVTDRLGVPPEDLNVTVKHAVGGPADVQPILVYDNVPAGAGLVGNLEDPAFMRACLESALEHVSGRCGCGEDKSCYGCLRSYRNQFAHDKLQRGPVRRYIETLLDRWS